MPIINPENYFYRLKFTVNPVKEYIVILFNYKGQKEKKGCDTHFRYEIKLSELKEYCFQLNIGEIKFQDTIIIEDDGIDIEDDIIIEDPNNEDNWITRYPIIDDAFKTIKEDCGIKTFDIILPYIEDAFRKILDKLADNQ